MAIIAIYSQINGKVFELTSSHFYQVPDYIYIGLFWLFNFFSVLYIESLS